MPDAPKPVRLQLSRRKGFDLQAHSKAINGLEAINCSRPGPYGNRFVVSPRHSGNVNVFYIAVPSADDAVECFDLVFEQEDAGPGSWGYELRAALPKLRGKNLACWCAVSEPCHCNVLLRRANG